MVYLLLGHRKAISFLHINLLLSHLTINYFIISNNISEYCIGFFYVKKKSHYLYYKDRFIYSFLSLILLIFVSLFNMLVTISLHCQNDSYITGRHGFILNIKRNTPSVKYIISEIQRYQISGSLSSISFTRLRVL